MIVVPSISSGILTVITLEIHRYKIKTKKSDIFLSQTILYVPVFLDNPSVMKQFSQPFC